MFWSYYIYYRVDPEKTTACAAAVQAVFSAVRKTTGVQGRMLTKREEPLLWMEIYEHVSDEARFEWALAEAVAAAGIPDMLQPGTSRHTECFS